MSNSNRYAMTSRTALVLAAIGVIACAGSDTSAPSGDPLSSFTRVQAKDSAAAPVDTAPSATTPGGPGYFQGLLVGYTPVGADTLANSVRLTNALVTVYRQGTDGRASGDAVATTTTDASGHWQTATLSSGSYVLTFAPSSGSDYAGAWTVGYASPVSGSTAWWIMVQHQ